MSTSTTIGAIPERLCVRHGATGSLVTTGVLVADDGDDVTIRIGSVDHVIPASTIRSRTVLPAVGTFGTGR